MYTLDGSSSQWQSHDGRTTGSVLLSSAAIFSSYKNKGFFYFQYLFFFNLNHGVLLNVLNCILCTALHCDDVLFVGFPVPREEQSSTISWCLQELVGLTPEHLNCVFWWNSGPPSTLKPHRHAEAKWSVMQWCVLMQCVCFQLYDVAAADFRSIPVMCWRSFSFHKDKWSLCIGMIIFTVEI